MPHPVGKDIPRVPSYEITGLNITNVSVPGSDHQAIRGDVVAQTKNPWPIELVVPLLGFEVLAPNCEVDDEAILVADATTNPFVVHPESDVSLSASGIIRHLPEMLTQECANTGTSPLDRVLDKYLHGEAATFYVRGRGLADTPQWIVDIMSQVTFPVDFPGHSSNHIVRNFSVVDLEFQLPGPIEDPNDADDGKVLISGTVEVFAALPPEMRFDVKVTGMRASAELFYQSRKLGKMHLDEWQSANSTRVGLADASEILLKIISHVKDVPLEITDGDVFADVIEKLLFGNKDVVLNMQASVDGAVETVLGELIIKGIPTEGSVLVKRPLKPLS